MFLSPLPSHNFLASQVVNWQHFCLQATNSMPAKLIATFIFLHMNMNTLSAYAVMSCNIF